MMAMVIVELRCFREFVNGMRAFPKTVVVDSRAGPPMMASSRRPALEALLALLGAIQLRKRCLSKMDERNLKTRCSTARDMVVGIG
jgi:hypothetical protein